MCRYWLVRAIPNEDEVKEVDAAELAQVGFIFDAVNLGILTVIASTKADSLDDAYDNFAGGAFELHYEDETHYHVCPGDIVRDADKNFYYLRTIEGGWESISPVLHRMKRVEPLKREEEK